MGIEMWPRFRKTGEHRAPMCDEWYWHDVRERPVLAKNEYHDSQYDILEHIDKT